MNHGSLCTSPSYSVKFWTPESRILHNVYRNDGTFLCLEKKDQNGISKSNPIYLLVFVGVFTTVMEDFRSPSMVCL